MYLKNIQKEKLNCAQTISINYSLKRSTDDKHPFLLLLLDDVGRLVENTSLPLSIQRGFIQNNLEGFLCRTVPFRLGEGRLLN